MEIDNIAGRVHAGIAAVCPIQGVSIGRRNDKRTWRIDFDDAATDAQKDAARAALQSFNVAASDAQAAQDEIREKRIQARMRTLAEKIDADPTILDRL